MAAPRKNFQELQDLICLYNYASNPANPAPERRADILKDLSKLPWLKDYSEATAPSEDKWDPFLVKTIKEYHSFYKNLGGINVIEGVRKFNAEKMKAAALTELSAAVRSFLSMTPGNEHEATTYVNYIIRHQAQLSLSSVDYPHLNTICLTNPALAFKAIQHIAMTPEQTEAIYNTHKNNDGFKKLLAEEAFGGIVNRRVALAKDKNILAELKPDHATTARLYLSKVINNKDQLKREDCKYLKYAYLMTPLDGLDALRNLNNILTADDIIEIYRAHKGDANFREKVESPGFEGPKLPEILKREWDSALGPRVVVAAAAGPAAPPAPAAPPPRIAGPADALLDEKLTPMEKITIYFDERKNVAFHNKVVSIGPHSLPADAKLPSILTSELIATLPLPVVVSILTGSLRGIFLRQGGNPNDLLRYQREVVERERGALRHGGVDRRGGNFIHAVRGLAAHGHFGQPAARRPAAPNPLAGPLAAPGEVGASQIAERDGFDKSPYECRIGMSGLIEGEAVAINTGPNQQVYVDKVTFDEYQRRQRGGLKNPFTNEPLEAKEFTILTADKYQNIVMDAVSANFAKNGRPLSPTEREEKRKEYFPTPSPKPEIPGMGRR